MEYHGFAFVDLPEEILVGDDVVVVAPEGPRHLLSIDVQSQSVLDVDELLDQFLHIRLAGSVRIVVPEQYRVLRGELQRAYRTCQLSEGHGSPLARLAVGVLLYVHAGDREHEELTAVLVPEQGEAPCLVQLLLRLPPGDTHDLVRHALPIEDADGQVLIVRAQLCPEYVLHVLDVALVLIL